MKKKLLSVLSLATVLGVNAQIAPSAFKSNGSASSGEIAYSICADENKNVYAGGIVAGTMTDGAISVSSAGGNDGYIAKYNSNGQLLWAKSVGGSGTDMALSVSYSKGFVYVSGVFNNTATFGSQTLTSKGQDDGFLAKYDSSGTFIWVKQFGSTWLDRVDKLVVGANEDLFVCASLGSGVTYAGNTLSNAGGIDGYLFKLDSSGQILDYENIGGSSNDYAYGLSVKNGSPYLTGLYASNTLTSGVFNISKLGQYDGFVLKMDGSLNTVWLSSFGGSDYDGGNQTLIDDNGNCYVGGYCTGSYDFGNVHTTGSVGISDGVIAKYDSIGNVIWVRKAGVTSFCHFRDLCFGASQNEIQAWGHFKGDVVIEGQTYSSASVGELDFFYVTYGTNGAVTEVKTYGGTNEENITNVIRVGNDTWVSGSFNTSTVFNSLVYNSVGGMDIGLWKFSLPSTGIKNADATMNTVQVFPNPSNGFIELQSDEKVNEVTVFDQLGKMVYHKESINTNSVSLELGLPDGIYFIQANAESGILTQKLLIKQ
jgi:hypothetical protein